MAFILLKPATTLLRLSGRTVLSNPMTPLELTNPECPGCLKLRRELDVALARIAELEAQVQELRLQLERNSSNCSTPPSANPPGAPKPVVKPPTGRKPGRPTRPSGTSSAVRLPAGSGQRDRRPTSPRSAPTATPPCPIEPGPGDPEPTWHQVAEIPELAADRHRAPRPRPHLPRLRHAQSRRHPRRRPRPRHRPAAGGDDVLPRGRHHLSRRGRARNSSRTVFERADLAGHRRHAGAADQRGLGRGP